MQKRGEARVEAVVAAAHSLLAEKGLGGFSIPALAERLGFSRMSVYHFFPTPHAILNEVARRALDGLEQRLTAEAAHAGNRRWREQVAAFIQTVVSYYTENPVAQMVVTSSSLTPEGYSARSLMVGRLGELTHRMFQTVGLSLPHEPIDIPTLAVDLGTTCLYMSLQRHGRITQVFQDEATAIMIRYLEPHVHAAAQARNGSRRNS